MALTKARPPATAISNMAFGTTQIDIPNAGGDIDIDVASANVIDLGSTTITVDDLVSLIVKNITTEIVTLSTAAGSDGIVQTNATEMEVGTTDLTPLELMVNSIPQLTIATDGKVTLGTVGTAASHLVDKDYVDTQIASGAANTATVATNGQLIVQATPNDIILKWGQKTGTGSRTITFADDTAAYPNACFIAMGQPINAGTASSDGWYSSTSISTTGFTWTDSRGNFSNNVQWWAVGY